MNLDTQLIAEPQFYAETIVFPWFGIGSQKENTTNREETVPSLFYFKKCSDVPCCHSYLLKKNR